MAGKREQLRIDLHPLHQQTHAYIELLKRASQFAEGDAQNNLKRAVEKLKQIARLFHDVGCDAMEFVVKWPDKPDDDETHHRS